MAMNTQVYNELINRIEIKDVVLGNTTIERHWAGTGQPSRASVEIEFSPEQPVFVGDELWVKAKFAVKTVTEEDGGSDAKPVFTLRFELGASYLVSQGNDLAVADYEDELRHFAKNNFPINIWPYAREFVSSISVRMGFPALIMGVYRAMPNR